MIPIYRFDSKYDPGTTQGSQQDKIIGIEYMGDDFKTILLSFPLYYIDTADARKLINHVIKNKFINPLSIPDTRDPGNFTVKIYPNPFSDETTISYSAPETAQMQIQIYNLQGKQVGQIKSQTVEKGNHTLSFSCLDLPSGIYFCRIQVGNKNGVGKIVVVK